MNPAPHRIGNFEIEELELMNSFLIKIICLTAKGGAG